MVKPKNPRRRCGSEMGRERKQRTNTRMAGKIEAHDSRIHGSAKSNGLGDNGQSMTRHSSVTGFLDLRVSLWLLSRGVYDSDIIGVDLSIFSIGVRRCLRWAPVGGGTRVTQQD